MQTVKKIDIHVHTSESGWLAHATPFATPEQLIEIYDEIGVERGVLLPVVNSLYVTSSNWENKRITDRYPDRFSWFCVFDPWQGNNSEHTDFTPFLEECIKNGAKGIGEMTANIYFDDPRCLNLMAQCEKLSLPLLFHVGQLGGDYGLADELGLPRLEKVLGMFPSLRFIGHSQKFWAEISGDITEELRNAYPTGPIREGGRLITLLRKYPNLSCDLSAGSGYNAMTRDPEFAYSFMEEFADRIFYGTDICSPLARNYPLIRLAGFLDETMQNGKISYDAYYKISRGNALKLLGFEAQ